MSEEISEEELTEKIITICGELEDIGEKRLSKKLFEKIEKKLEFVSLSDWENHQICSTFPKIDIRDLVFCCSPSNNCPYRAAVLRKLGLSLGDYTQMKKRFAAGIKLFIWGLDKNGKNESE